MHQFSVGDTVAWETPQGTHEGTVVERHTAAFGFGRQQVTASEDKPVYVVARAEDGLRSIHMPETLRLA